MGLEKVKKEILNQAEQEAERILDEAEQQADELTASAKKQAEQIKEQAREKGNKQAHLLKREQLASANMKARQKEMEAKQEMIDQVFQQLEEEILSLSKKERKKLVKSAINRVSRETDIGTVYTSSDLVSDVENMVDAQVEEDDIQGVIIEDKSGNTRYDYTFQTVLENIKNSSRKETASQLF